MCAILHVEDFVIEYVSNWDTDLAAITVYISETHQVIHISRTHRIIHTSRTQRVI